MAGGLNLRLAMAQINAVVGDLEGNRAKILDWIGRARDLEADLVTFPELVLTGYPPEDLLLKPRFIERNLEILKELAAAVSGITAVVGFVDRREGIYNAAAILKDGQISGVYHKICLPNYGVFDEVRYFQVGKLSTMIEVGDVRVGLCICEDIWFPDGPAAQQAMEAGAEILINISSSPYHAGKRHERESMLRSRAIDNTAIVAYNNMVGGQDELVFDGDSLVFDEKGQIIARGAQFEEDLVVVDLDMEAVGRSRLKDPGRLQRGDSEEITVVSIPGPRSDKKPLPQVEIREPLGGRCRSLPGACRRYTGLCP